MPTTHIRRLRKEDIDILIPVATKTFEETYPGHFSAEDLASFFDKEIITAELSSGKVSYFLALDDDRLVGYAKLVFNEDGGSLLSKLYVLKEAQGKGLGKALLSEALMACADRSGDLMLHVWKDNATAISFYEKFGFLRTGKIIKLEFNGKEFEDYEMSVTPSDLVARPTMSAGGR